MTANNAGSGNRFTDGDVPAVGLPTSAPPAVAVVQGISGIDRLDWDACAAGHGPFLSHACLKATEDSGLAGPAAGWYPVHLMVREASGRVVGTAPLYLRDRSTDEHWPDQVWVDGYQAAGGRYFPKLVSAVPYAPVAGPRLLLRQGAPPGTADALIGAMRTLAHRDGLSSIHVSFPDETDRCRFEAAGWLTRHAVDYEWRNAGYRNFGDFAASLTKHRRDTLLWERRKVLASGVRFRDVPGSRVGESDVVLFLGLFDDLHARRGTSQPLTADFVHRLCAALGDAVTLTFAEAGGVAVGTLLTVEGDGRLYVRNWGARKEARLVHFETCYCRTVERAIALGLDAVDGGRGGPHKLARGFRPKLTHACHWFRHTNMHRTVAEGLALHNARILAALALEQARSPFRQPAGGIGDDARLHRKAVQATLPA
ncbi:GNAT family N-acetyltransferase [Azospirillum humicireducens]|uniref:GNAT family N-acetyltransferase n=1 Tax=Azospirillum humicireducens TaxID=1226968 RepID=A0A160JIA9_9PROT|nr:GNAT family N-acetyltransferase [Azospirillum humicireducens]ANC92855.2 GNAT family N-acetyltransferase [Azospirillum humicireducens]